MPRRGDNIHKRKDGRWEGRYHRGRKSNGNILYGSVYGKTYNEAKSKLMFAVNHPQPIHTGKLKNYTFGEASCLWLENNKVRLKGATINKYQALIDSHILPTLGAIKLSEISATVINNFANQKLKNGRIDCGGGLSASYVRSIMIIVDAVLKFAVNEEMCRPLQNPIFKPSVAHKSIIVLDKKEQKQLETFLTERITPTKAGILITLYTGLRIGEICALDWKNIDLQNNIISVLHTVARVREQDNKSRLIIDAPKTRASIREVPIVSTLIPILNHLKQNTLSQYVISENDSFVSPRTFEYRYRKILADGGIKYINYHALRHTFATRCIEAGMDVKTLSEILGHSSANVTLNTYVHSSLERKKSEIEKLSGLT